MSGLATFARASRTLRAALAGTTAIAGLALGGAAFAQDDANASSGNNEVVVTGSRIARRDYTAQTPIVSVSSQAFENKGQPELENTLNQLPQFQAGLNNQISQAQQVQPTATSTPGAVALNLRGLGPNRNLVLLDGRRPQPANASLFVDINSIPQAAIDSVEIITGGASAAYGADAISGVVNFKLKKNFQGMEVDAQYGFTQHGGGGEPNVSALIGGNFADDRGNAMVGVSYTQRAIILQRDRQFYLDGFNDPTTNAGGSYPFLPYGSFDWGINASFVGLPFIGNGPSAAALDAIFGPGVYPAAGSSVTVNPDQSVFYSGLGANGVGSPGYTGPLAPGFKIQNSGSLGFNNLNAPLSLPLTRWAMFTDSHYDITDHITAYLQGNFSETQVKTSVLASPAVQFWGAPIPHDAAHPVPAELEALLDSRNGGVDGVNFLGQPVGPSTPWALQIELDNFAGQRTTVDTTNTYQLTAGFKGDIPGTGLRWDVYGSHGKTTTDSDLVSGFASTDKLQKFLALPNWGQNGTLSLGSQQTATCTSGFYDTVFKGTAPTQDCIDAISAPMKTQSYLTQNIIEATVTGDLFQLPAGALSFALGADYREEDFKFHPDPLLDVHSIADSPVGLFPASPTNGFIDVKEGYAELLVPLLRDIPFFKKLDIDAGARYSDYNTAGGQWTYKITGDWSVNDWLSFRGGYQVANRAPNIAELYQPNTSFVVGAAAGDPCASSTPVPWGNNASNPNRLKTQQLCADLIHKFDPGFTYVPGTPSADNYTGLFPFYFPLTIDIQQGNLNLKPEQAKSYTAGIVLRSPIQSPLLSRAQLSVDWYKIDIAGAIQTVTSEISYEQCFNADGKSNPTLAIGGNSFCDFIEREVGTGGNRHAIAPYFNLGAINTDGIDVQFDWSADLADLFGNAPGALNLNFVLSWLDSYKIQNAPGGTFLNYAGTVNGQGGSQFKYKTYTTLTYALDMGSLGMRWRHLPSARDAASLTNPATTRQPVDAHDEFDLFGTWKLTPNYSLRAGINNLFDAQPEVAGRDTGVGTANSALGLTLSDYDVIGRRFYVGIKARF